MYSGPHLFVIFICKQNFYYIYFFSPHFRKALFTPPNFCMNRFVAVELLYRPGLKPALLEGTDWPILPMSASTFWVIHSFPPYNPLHHCWILPWCLQLLICSVWWTERMQSSQHFRRLPKKEGRGSLYNKHTGRVANDIGASHTRQYGHILLLMHKRLEHVHWINGWETKKRALN